MVFLRKKRRRSKYRRLVTRYFSKFLPLLIVGIVLAYLGGFFDNAASLFQQNPDSVLVTPAVPAENTPDEDPVADNNFENKISEQIIEETELKPDTDSIRKINELTEQLLQEQKKSRILAEQLNQQSAQNLELQKLIEKEVKKVSQISGEDHDYISALNNENKKTEKKVVDKSVIESVDYYNKVRTTMSGASQNDNNGLQDTINEIMIEGSGKEKVEKTYVNNLKIESEVRQNEVRSIVLKKGDTLWELARRAYGKGILYSKIIKANPQITEKNVRFLRPGTVIRVPI